MNKLPEFKPLPEVDNLRSNYMSAFNHGMNIYEALVYLQGYVQITYNSMDDLLNDWNNFEQYITENISQIANEKTQEILNQWKSDGTLNEIIEQNPLWNQKVNKAGDVMSGDLQFQEETGVYGTSASGQKVNLAKTRHVGSSNYVDIGHDDSQAVIYSNEKPVWSNNGSNKDLITEEDLNTTKSDIREIQDKIETGAYFTNDVGGQPTITNYQENKNVSIIQPSDVVNNLNSTETNKPLSANQGKILNDKFNGIKINSVNNALIAIGTIRLNIQNKAYAILFTGEQIKQMLGLSSYRYENVVAVVTNGNSSLLGEKIDATYMSTDGSLSITLYKSATGNFAVNYAILYKLD